jgi:1,4-dihydroxy-2-naphthoate octaprenyltransferase
LSAATVPVLVGTALAYGNPGFSWGVFALTLVASLLVQIGANFVDEYSDHGATASAHKYLAPHKVIARGLLTPGQVKAGAVAVFGAATLIGAGLVARAGLPLLWLCLGSLAVAYLYSGGPLPLGDYALGEPLVFVTMGPVMVMGTVYAQLSAWDPKALVYSLPVAALVTAILVANNLRDGDEDRRNGRRTLVTLFGRGAVRIGYLALLLVAFAVPAVRIAQGDVSPWLWLPWLTLPLAVRVFTWIARAEDRDTLHRALRGTSALHLTFGVLLTVGLLA